MVDRTVRVGLVAEVSGYIAGMDAAQRKTAGFASDSATKLAAQRAAFVGLGTAALAVGALAAAGVALAVAKWAEFDRAMSQVKAVTQESAENMNLLRDAALEAGGRTIYTATEAAHAIEELGKNGLTTAQILGGGLNAALDIAASGGLEVARAAEIAAITMKQFRLEGGQLPHVADLLAAGAGKAAGDVEDMAQALNQAGLVAAQTGVSIEETTGVLSAFADAGLIGSDAGTSLRTMLLRLTPISGEAANKMDELKISAFDTSGEFIGMSEFAGVLQDRLGTLNTEQRNLALTQIFGQDAIRGANRLYELGAVGVQRYIDQTNDAGYAAKVAADRLDNLSGDVEKLGGAFDTYLIKSGSGANDILRLMVQTATGLVDGLGNLPAPALAAGLGIGAVAAAVLLVSGAALIAVPKIAAMKVQMADAGISAGALARGIGIASGALSAATLIFAWFAARQGEVTAMTQEFGDSLDQTTGLITDYTRELVAKKLAESGAFEAAERAGVSQQELTQAVIEGGDALDAVQKKLTATNTAVSFFADANNDMSDGFQSTGIEAGNAADSIRQLDESLGGSQERFMEQQKAASGATDSVTSAADAYHEASDQAAELQSNLMALIDTINEANGVGQDAVSTNAAYQQTLADVDEYIRQAQEGVEGYSLGFDKNTVAGSANQDMLRELAADSQAAAEAQFKLDGNTTAYRSTLEATHQAVYDRAILLGATTDEALALADSIAQIPTEAEFQMIAETFAAQQQIDNFIRTNDGRTISVNVGYNPGAGGAYTLNESGGFYQRGVRAFEGGGFPSGMYAGRRGGIHKFAEENLPWEVYISPKPGKERENTDYALEALARLGYSGYVGGNPAESASPPSAGAPAPQQSGPTTAYLDAATARDLRALLSRHQQMLDTVGLASAAQSGSGRLAQLGSN